MIHYTCSWCMIMIMMIGGVVEDWESGVGVERSLKIWSSIFSSSFILIHAYVMDVAGISRKVAK